MSDSERRAGGLLFMGIGAVGFLASVIAIVGPSPAPTTTSPLRAAITAFLAYVFGDPAGHVAYHFVFAAGSAAMAWLGFKLRSS